MIRFVRGPDGNAVPDLAAKLPGRGAWVSARRDAIERAVSRKAFSRAFKSETAVQDGLAAAIEAGLAEKVLSAFGLARRAGEAQAGFDQARAALKSGGVALLAEGADGAADGRDKLFGLVKTARDPILIVGYFDSDALGLALGRGRVVHLTLQHGAAAKRAAREARRLAGFRALVPESWRPSLEGDLS